MERDRNGERQRDGEIERWRDEIGEYINRSTKI